MNANKIIASALLALMALSPLSAAVSLGDFPAFLAETTDGTSSLAALFVVGASAAPSDVVAAIDLAARAAAVNYVQQTVAGAPGALSLSGGVSLDAPDEKIYLGDPINKVKDILTEKDLSFLASGAIFDSNGNKLSEYRQYLRIGSYAPTFDQPDPTGGMKDPAYFIRLGTDPSTNWLIQLWISFNKQVDFTQAVGQSFEIAGREFVVSAETDNTQLVLFGTAGETNIQAGETKTIQVGDQTHEVTVVGIIDSRTAVLQVNGITKEVTEGDTVDFGGVSVYVKDVFYYVVPEETGSVTVSIGADRYVFQDGQPIKHGPAGNEESIKGTHVSFPAGEDPTRLSAIMINFDSWSASPRVDYILAGSAYTVPVFGFQVAYDGPITASEEISVAPGSADYYTATFTNKFGQRATVEWAYNSGGTPVLADSLGNAIYPFEYASAGLNEYLFAADRTSTHMLQVVNIDATNADTTVADTGTVQFKDAFSGETYDVSLTETGANTNVFDGTLVLDGIQYAVQYDGTTGKVTLYRSGASDTVVYPTIETSEGAFAAFTDDLTDVVTDTDGTQTTAGAGGYLTVQLPTGTIYLDSYNDGANNHAANAYSLDGTNWVPMTGATSVNVGGVAYVITPSTTDGTFDIALDADQDTTTATALTDPALLLIQDTPEGATTPDAWIFPITYDTTDSRLELQSIISTHSPSEIWQSSTSDPDVTKYADVWGTEVTHDVSAAGTATVIYPGMQRYHLVAVGENPAWTTGEAVEGGTFNVVAPVTTPVAKLDTEVTDADKAAYHLVLVGGPAVNRLTAEVWGLDYPTYGAESGIPENKAVIEVIPDAFASGKNVLVVAGWEAEHTRLAAQLLMSGALEGETASKVIVSGTLQSPVIEAA